MDGCAVKVRRRPALE